MEPELPEFGPHTVSQEIAMWIYFVAFVAGILAFGFYVSIPILLVTLAPERAGATGFIAGLTQRGKVGAMAHSSAGFADVTAAADAGMTLSTHLGNGLPQQLPKLENTLLAQLAEPRLTACLIADGHHMSPAALAALIRLKGLDNCILVTDAVLGAARHGSRTVAAPTAPEYPAATALPTQRVGDRFRRPALDAETPRRQLRGQLADAARSMVEQVVGQDIAQFDAAQGYRVRHEPDPAPRR